MAFSTYTPALYPNLRQQTFTSRQLVTLPFNGLLRIERGAVRAVTWSEQGTPMTAGESLLSQIRVQGWSVG